MESDLYSTVHETPTEAASPNIEPDGGSENSVIEPQTSNATQPASLETATSGSDSNLVQESRARRREAIIADAEFNFRNHVRRRAKIDRTSYVFRGLIVDWSPSTVYNATKQQKDEAQ